MVQGRVASPTVRVWRRATCVILGLCWAPQARAQPMVRVRAGSEIELQAAQNPGGTQTLRGSLLDELGAALSDRRVELSIRAEASAGSPLQRTLQTGEDGRFATTLELPPGRYAADARFDGDAHTGASELSRPLDFTKADVELRFVEPREPRLDLDADAHAVAVLASSARGGEGLHIGITDERGRVLARGTTDAEGLYRVVLASNALGPAAMGRIAASSDGDTQRNHARVELNVLRFRHTALALRADADRDHERLVLSGALRTRDAPVAGEAIGLFDGPQHLATLRTDAGGRFRHAALPLPAPGHSSQTFHLQARFDSDAVWLGSSRSRVVDVTLAPAPTPSPLWLVGAVCVCVLALIWVSRREPRPPAPVASAPTARSAGIHVPSRPARARADRFAIEGVVLDAMSAEPVSAALLRLQGNGGTTIELASDPSGRFRSPPLAAGDWVLRVGAPGYVGLEDGLSIPHRGPWSSSEIRLQSLRSAAVAAYKPVAVTVLPSPSLWDRWTPRETLADARRRGRATESFVQLTERVERAAYGGATPTDAEVEEIARAASEERQPRWGKVDS